MSIKKILDWWHDFWCLGDIEHEIVNHYPMKSKCKGHAEWVGHGFAWRE